LRELIRINQPFLGKEEIDAAVEVLRSGILTDKSGMGPRVLEFERSFAKFVGAKHAVAVVNGTAALHASLLAADVGPGDEVILPSFTFVGAANAVVLTGATPVFVDIDPKTYNLDAGQIESKVTGKTRAIIPVHLYGQMADMDVVMAVAGKHGLVVIEDAAQAIGAEHKGRRAGSIGHYGCFSFFPSKNLGAAGDGGMIVTNDAGRAEKLKCLRAHGSKPKYHHKIVGGNFRLDAIQAAIVTAKLRHLDQWTAGRQQNAKKYNQFFAEAGLVNAGGAAKIGLPAVVTERHIFNQYVIRLSQRDQLQAALQLRGIGTEVYYPIPMHLQECFAFLGNGVGAYPESERAAKETLALPIYPELSEEQLRYVVESVRDFCTTDPVVASASQGKTSELIELQSRR